MAIINCPECNEKMSSLTNECVHCGAKVTYCPECEQASVGIFVKCPECGYDISKAKEEGTAKKRENVERNEQPEDCATVMRAWIKENPLRKLYCNVFLRNVLAVLDLVVFISVLLKVAKASSSDALYMIAAASIIMFVVQDIYNTHMKDIGIIDLSNWAIQRKIDLEDAIRNSLSNDCLCFSDEEKQKRALNNNNMEYFFKLIIGTNYLLDCEIFRKDAIARNKLITFKIFHIGSFITFFVLLFDFLIKNAKIYIYKQTWEYSEYLGLEGWTFSDITGWWILIVSAAFLVVYFVLSFSNFRLNLRKSWVQKHYPEHYENYEKQIAGVDVHALHAFDFKMFLSGEK